jgi:two-component system NarL family sensor kinase
LTLETTGDFLTLMVSDNGHGFDTERYLLAPPTVSAGIGLRSVREQVEALGGEFRIRSGENGTKLEVALPAILSGDS